MLLLEHEVEIAAAPGHRAILDHLTRTVPDGIPQGFAPVRFVITRSDDCTYQCEIGGIFEDDWADKQEPDSIFRFVRRAVENTAKFTTVLLVPTGIGAEIGGHAGDAGPVAKLLGRASDRLILHPNVVNASDINEMPENALYVEGSVICRLLMGTVGLQPVRSNRVLVVIDDHENELFVNLAVNAVSGARSSYGLTCPEVVRLNPTVKMKARFAPSGRATGRVGELEGLTSLLDLRKDDFDAVSISSVIGVPYEYHQGYFDAQGKMVNPWGGVEAMLTHSLSSIYNVPTAHSPMFESVDIANMDPGIVDPRMAAEAVSSTFLQCTLKGLQRSPRIITEHDAMARPDVLAVEDISCLIIPEGCLGLPTLAALEQGITVITVRENRNVMQNDLASLPWQAGRFFQAENYWEAAGLVSALRAGIDPASVRRPLSNTAVSTKRTSPAKETCSSPKEDAASGG